MIALNRCPSGWVQWSSCQRHSPRSAGTCSPFTRPAQSSDRWIPAKVNAQLGEERLAAATNRARRDAIHTGRPGSTVTPNPPPGSDQEGGITDKVVEVLEPATGVAGCPSVQLGLDPQYPRLRLLRRRPRRADIHRRPPGMPAPALRTGCRPWPCSRLSRPRTTTAAPSHPRVISRRRTCPPPARLAGGEGNPGAVPTFTTHRSTGAVPSCSPAASPRLRRRPSPWPPGRRILPAVGVDHPSDGRALLPGPYPPGWSRF